MTLDEARVKSYDHIYSEFRRKAWTDPDWVYCFTENEDYSPEEFRGPVVDGFCFLTDEDEAADDWYEVLP